MKSMLIRSAARVLRPVVEEIERQRAAESPVTVTVGGSAEARSILERHQSVIVYSPTLSVECCPPRKIG